jgi:hypothetical protein
MYPMLMQYTVSVVVCMSTKPKRAEVWTVKLSGKFEGVAFN